MLIFNTNIWYNFYKNKKTLCGVAFAIATLFAIAFFSGFPLRRDKRYLEPWSENNDFVKYLINSKKFPKNVKFGLQAHFNMKNTLEGSNRLFELWKWKYEGGCTFGAQKRWCILTPLIYILQIFFFIKK